MTNMQKLEYAPHFAQADGALPLPQVGLSGRGSDSDGGCDSSHAEAILQWHPLWQRLWRLVFSQHWTKMIRPICLTRRSCACTDTLRLTAGQDHRLLSRARDILAYPSIFGNILS